MKKIILTSSCLALAIVLPLKILASGISCPGNDFVNQNLTKGMNVGQYWQVSSINKPSQGEEGGTQFRGATSYFSASLKAYTVPMCQYVFFSMEQSKITGSVNLEPVGPAAVTLSDSPNAWKINGSQAVCFDENYAPEACTFTVTHLSNKIN